MDASVQVADAGNYLVLKGPDRAAVEAAVREHNAAGAITVGAVAPLGNNWVATVRNTRSPTARDWVEVTSIGLQSVVEGSSEAVVRARLRELTNYGAALVAGPEEVQGKWVAVVDVREGAQAPVRRRA